MGHEGARSDFADLLVDSRTVRDHLDGFVRRAGARLGDGTHCSLSLRHSGRHRVAVTDGPRPAACDEVEFRYGSGPCLTAMDDRSTVP